MKLTKKNIEFIKKQYSKFDPENNLDIEFLELEIGEETVFISFPREHENIEVPVQDFLKYFSEIESIRMSENKVSVPKITQIPINSSHASIDGIIEEFDFKVDIPGKFKIRIVSNPILIGFAAVKLGYYDKYIPPCSFYHAVEIEYYSLAEQLGDDSENKILKSFLFELSHICKSSVNFSNILQVDFYDYDEENNFEIINLDHLRPYSEGMDLYLKALESDDKEISFLYYYKIIEYYSPVAARISAFEILSRKLESLKYKSPKNEDLNKIFEISDAYRKSKSDNELTQTVIAISIDIVDLIIKLPESIIKKISKNLSLDVRKVNYSTANDNIGMIINQLSKILYSTRNMIVHAKSNFNSDKYECDRSDLEGLNNFLRDATYQIIDWHSKLPSHIKTDN